MRLAVLKERRVPENRVAATPDTVKRLIGLGLTVVVETGAGLSSSIPDSEFAAVVLGACFLAYAIGLYRRYSDALARRTFRFSIVYLSLLFAALLVDHYIPL